MSSLNTAVLLFTSAFFSANVQATPTTINFDDLGPSTVIGSHYAALGVTFSQAMTVEYRSGIPVFAAFPGSSYPTTIKSTESFANGFEPQPSNPISASFSMPVSFVSLTGISINQSGYLLRAYDSVVGGNLVSASQVVGPPHFGGTGGNDFFANLSVTGSGIRRVEFSQLNSSGIAVDDIIFDNLVFQPQLVPEISSHAMLLTGLPFLAIAIFRRRRAK